MGALFTTTWLNISSMQTTISYIQRDNNDWNICFKINKHFVVQLKYKLKFIHHFLLRWMKSVLFMKNAKGAHTFVKCNKVYAYTQFATDCIELLVYIILSLLQRMACSKSGVLMTVAYFIYLTQKISIHTCYIGDDDYKL